MQRNLSILIFSVEELADSGTDHATMVANY